MGRVYPYRFQIPQMIWGIFALLPIDIIGIYLYNRVISNQEFRQTGENQMNTKRNGNQMTIVMMYSEAYEMHCLDQAVYRTPGNGDSAYIASRPNFTYDYAILTPEDVQAQLGYTGWPEDDADETVDEYFEVNDERVKITVKLTGENPTII